MPTDINVSQLIINKLTQAQFDEAKAAGTISDTELYMITDSDDGNGTGGENCVTVDGGGNLTMEAALGSAPYVIEFTTEDETINANVVEYNNSNSELTATDTQAAIDEVVTNHNTLNSMVDSLQREVAANKQILDTKQTKLTGTSGQIVVFDNTGNLVASDPIAAARAQGTVLNASNWVDNGDGRYAQTLPVLGVTADIEQVIVVDVALTGIDLTADATILEAWRGTTEGSGPASQNCVQNEGYLTFYTIIPPTVNIPLNIGVC